MLWQICIFMVLSGTRRDERLFCFTNTFTATAADMAKRPRELSWRLVIYGKILQGARSALAALISYVVARGSPSTLLSATFFTHDGNQMRRRVKSSEGLTRHHFSISLHGLEHHWEMNLFTARMHGIREPQAQVAGCLANLIYIECSFPHAILSLKVS